MKLDRFAKILLLVIAVSLVAIALRPYLVPPPVEAQWTANSLYFEPGTTMLIAPDGSQQVLGKVAVDMRTGNVWGFPTLSPNPYPSAGVNSGAPVSHPFLLGRFAFADMKQ